MFVKSFRLAAPILCALALIAAPANAQTVVRETVTTEVTENGRTTITTITTVTTEEWVIEDGASTRFVDMPVLQGADAIAGYGPFKVLDAKRAALSGITDSHSPAAFARMLAAYPGIEVLEMHDCGGTFDDRANLELGRMIRAAGIATHVPDGGSVRSGAVELFLAGAQQKIDDGAEFAVHAWEDENGMQAGDFAMSAPQNAKYLKFYQEMGMERDAAYRFYAMTNSVRHEQALWMDAEDMRGWLSVADMRSGARESSGSGAIVQAEGVTGVAPQPATSSVELSADSPVEKEHETTTAPQLAYLDLTATLN